MRNIKLYGSHPNFYREKGSNSSIFNGKETIGENKQAVYKTHSQLRHEKMQFSLIKRQNAIVRIRQKLT